jgi:hypothetical protein
MSESISETWNKTLAAFDNKLNKFVNENAPIKVEKFYSANATRVQENFVTHYSHTCFYIDRDARPTKKRLIELKEKIENFKLSTDSIYCYYYYLYESNGVKAKASTAIKYNDLMLIYQMTEEEVTQVFEQEDAKRKSAKQFQETHAKDKYYNYSENGYKFLGWQNSWKYDWVDVDGNITLDPLKRKYSRPCNTYTDFWDCRNLNHQTIEVRHDASGSENTVSCPLCKVYWKYDCSG